MGTTIGHKDVATTGSGHTAPGPPETSLNPPTPPAGPIPGPWPCLARSATASSTASCLKVGGDEVLTENSVMDIDQPGNQVSQPTGGDLVTHAVVGKAPVTSGSSSTTADGKGVSCTGDSVALNTMTAQAEMSQGKGVLVKAGGADMGGGSGDAEADATKKMSVAAPARGADKAGDASAPPSEATPAEGDPVDVVSGAVIDRQVDFALPGLIGVEWTRSYSSARAKERGLLGKGGWQLGFEQWIERRASAIVYHAGDGREIYFEPIGPGQSTYHRRERLTLVALDRERFEVRTFAERQTRRFEPRGDAGTPRLVAISDRYGNTISLEHDGDRLARVVDTAKREIRLLYDPEGRVGRVEIWAEGAMRQWTDYAYSPEGELSRAADALGHAETYAYDGVHRLAVKSLKNGLSFRYRYDDDTGRCVRSIGDGKLHEVELAFDLEAKTTLSSGNERPRIYTWNDKGVVVREETPDGSSVREREYDDDLFLLSESNGAGEKIAIEYDDRGRRVQFTDPAGNVTRFEFDGDLVKKRVEPTGLETVLHWDGRGALIGIDHPNGQRVERHVDGQGRLTAAYGDAGLIAKYAYDAAHNVVEVTDGSGNKTRYAYDPLGRPIERVDATGKSARVEYDRIGRPRVVHLPDGTRRETEYDALGNVVRKVDRLGRVTTMERGGTGVLLSMQRPGGESFKVGYDKLERTREIKNARGERLELRYDAAGRVVFQRAFDGSSVELSYSKAERVSRIDYEGDEWRELAYDPLGNVVADRSPHGTITFERNALGWLEKAVLDEYRGKVECSYERDKMGFVVAETQGSRTVRYQRDAIGRATERVLPDGQTTRYAFDGKRTLAIEHEGRRLEIHHDALGRETKRTLERAGVDVVSEFDAAHRLLSRKVSRGHVGDPDHAIISERTYGYDAGGRLLSVDDSRWGKSLFSYDAADNLVEARSASVHEVFDYDPTGTLERAFDEMTEKSPPHRWETLKGGLVRRAADVEFEYDARRRRIKKREKLADGREVETRYYWDARSRLREVRPPSGERVMFTYDAFGRRVRKEVVPAARKDLQGMLELAAEKGAAALPPIRVVEYLWDDDALAVELDSERGERAFVHEPGSLVPLFQIERGEVFTYVTDDLGVPVEMLDHDGQIAWAASHGPWGRETEVFCAPGRKLSSPFRLLGQIHDEETGLAWARYRSFDPAIGAWISPDPLGFHGGEHAFSFNGAPTLVVDPLGLEHGSASPPDEIAARGLGDETTSPWLADPRAGIASHLEMFRDGASFLIPKSAFEKYLQGKDTWGEEGNFVSTKANMDKVLAESTSLSDLKQRLGIPEKYWNEPMYRVDVNNPLLHDARLPSGMERGANDMFRPGGYTSGGAPEATLQPFPASDANVSDTGFAPPAGGGTGT